MVRRLSQSNETSVTAVWQCIWSKQTHNDLFANETSSNSTSHCKHKATKTAARRKTLNDGIRR